MKFLFNLPIALITILFLLPGCNSRPHGIIEASGRLPNIEPDYSDVTIPPNIAPLNFCIIENGSGYLVQFSVGSETNIKIGSNNGKIQIPERKWKKMLMNNKGKDLKVDIYVKNKKGEWSKFKTITNNIAPELIDPYIFYRQLYPGYESWAELSIKERNLENFREKSLIENSVIDDNCVNCHSFNNGRSDDFLFHVRGNLGGTYFYSGGEFRKVNLKTKEMKNGVAYPRWHPSGKFVAFSSNKIVQRFHAADNKKVEVSDLESSLVIYNVKRNEMMSVEFPGKNKFMDTFPEWSPDGNWLYFCRTGQIGETYDYKQIKYNLYRVPFDSNNLSFGTAELVFDASKLNKSVSFPRISPNGRFLVLTMADYGCFPIWHKEADLYSIDLRTMIVSRLELNSDFTDSYHSWSSNGRWLVFSSKRGDGLSARPYISYMDINGNSSKPFILPQKDPEFYQRFLKSFNIPELSTFKIDLKPWKFRKLAKTVAIQPSWRAN